MSHGHFRQLGYVLNHVDVAVFTISVSVNNASESTTPRDTGPHAKRPPDGIAIHNLFLRSEADDFRLLFPSMGGKCLLGSALIFPFSLARIKMI